MQDAGFTRPRVLVDDMTCDECGYYTDDGVCGLTGDKENPWSEACEDFVIDPKLDKDEPSLF
jgi:hypothetical protein